MASLDDNPALAARFPSEIYRQKLDQMYGRLDADQYHSGQDLLDDLEVGGLSGLEVEFEVHGRALTVPLI